MKKLFSLFFVIIIALSLLVSCSKSEPDVPSGMKKASGDDVDYILYIPEGWIADMQTVATTAHVSSSDPSNISVTTWSLPNADDTIDTWWETTKGQFKETGFTDYDEESSEDIEICSYAGRKFVYTLKRGDEKIKYLQAVVIRDTYIYVITYTAGPNVFDSHLDDVNSIIDNFRI